MSGHDEGSRPAPPAWVRDAVFYQIFPDRFALSTRVPKPGPLEDWDARPTRHGFKGGDLLGIVEHLDHVQALGANAIYLNPVFQSASNHRYHTYDYLTVDPLLGGDAALRELIDACHVRGMRVILDGVFNHASRGFWPFHHVLESGEASPYRDWFFFDQEALASGRIRAYPVGRPNRGSLPALGYQAWWDLPALPKLNTGRPEVREYLMSVAEHWLRFGADGWRLDVPEEVPDDFWREFRRRVKAVDRDAYIVAEIWHEKPQDLRGDMYDALMDYPLAEAILSFTGAGRLDDRLVRQHRDLSSTVRHDDAPAFASRLTRAMSLYDPAVSAAQFHLLGSHDTPRFLSLVGGDTTALRLATLIQMTLPGAPSIFYGDEIGLLGEADPDNRRSFPWDHPERWDHTLFAFMSSAVALRHANPVFRRGTFRVVEAVGQAIAYRLADRDSAALVVVNAGDVPRRLALSVPELIGRSFVTRSVAGSVSAVGPDRVEVAGERLELDVPARDAVVLTTPSR